MLTILMMEDSPIQGEQIKEFLESHGFQVLWALDGVQGVALAAAQMPDLIVLDLEMPALDGLAACRLLKSTPQTAAIPIIVLTAHENSTVLRELLELGALDFIPKDAFSLPVLSETLHQLELG